MRRYELSDEDWALVGPLLPKQGRGGKARRAGRRIGGAESGAAFDSIGLRWSGPQPKSA